MTRTILLQIIYNPLFRKQYRPPMAPQAPRGSNPKLKAPSFKVPVIYNVDAFQSVAD
jgi:hypothetical protein